MSSKDFYEDLAKLIEILPPKISRELVGRDLDDIIEIVIDLGRPPEVRHSDGRIDYIGDDNVSTKDIEYTVSKINTFTSDNRAGIPGTLHRISAIRNRQGTIIGLTCRVGRVVTGTIACIRDIILTGKSILFLGRPGVGKTTKLREIARLIADEIQKRVVVVDTSNEIAGDGDIPHEGIGKARRMQVSSPEKQKDIMIEAVQNHTPEVIIVDEIGTEEEAQAARTIAERGVALVATAHGNILENLIKNPTLSDLVGGVNTVTLSDDEAKRRSTQKTVLEREKQPTFDVVIEIVDRNTLAVYPDVSEAVDCILRGYPIQPEKRLIDSVGNIVNIQEKISTHMPITTKLNSKPEIQKYINDVKDYKKVYIYSVSRSIVDKLIKRLNLNVEVTRNLDDADFVISHKSYAKGGAKIIMAAQEYNTPVYFVKSNTMPQIQKMIKQALNIETTVPNKHHDEIDAALLEVRNAIYKILNGEEEIELKPRDQQIRKLQHELIEKHKLQSVSIGEGEERHLKVVSDNGSEKVG